MLLFKKKFLPAIRAGEKTQTVRLWKFRLMRAGQRSYIPGAGYIRILDVDELRLDDLTDEDARLDGFASATALREEINTLYAERLAGGYRTFRIRFELAPDEQPREKPPREKKARGKRTPTD